MIKLAFPHGETRSDPGESGGDAVFLGRSMIYFQPESPSNLQRWEDYFWEVYEYLMARNILPTRPHLPAIPMIRHEPADESARRKLERGEGRSCGLALVMAILSQVGPLRPELTNLGEIWASGELDTRGDKGIVKVDAIEGKYAGFLANTSVSCFFLPLINYEQLSLAGKIAPERHLVLSPAEFGRFLTELHQPPERQILVPVPAGETGLRDLLASFLGERPSIIGARPSVPPQRKSWPTQLGLLLLGLFMSGLGWWFWSHHENESRPNLPLPRFEERAIGILCLDFAGTGSTEIQTRMRAQLAAALLAEGLLDATPLASWSSPRQPENMVMANQLARQVGQHARAKMVIWTERAGSVFYPHITITNNWKLFKGEMSVLKPLTLRLGEITIPDDFALSYVNICYFLIGLWHYQATDYDKAITAFRRAVQDGGENAFDVKRLLGISYYQRFRQTRQAADLALAEKIFLELLATCRDFKNLNVLREWSIHNNLGILYYQAGRLEQALAQFDGIEALAGAMDRLDSGMPWYELYANLGLIAMAAGQIDRAEICLTKAFRFDPANFSICQILAYVLYEKSKKDPTRRPEALQRCQECLKLQPNAAYIHNYLGSIYRQQQDFGQALAAYQQALAADSHFAAASFNIACIYALQGDIQKSWRFLSESLQQGFSDCRILQEEPDLAALRQEVRTSARFENLVQTCYDQQRKP